MHEFYSSVSSIKHFNLPQNIVDSFTEGTLFIVMRNTGGVNSGGIHTFHPHQHSSYFAYHGMVDDQFGIQNNHVHPTTWQSRPDPTIARDSWFPQPYSRSEQPDTGLEQAEPVLYSVTTKTDTLQNVYMNGLGPKIQNSSIENSTIQFTNQTNTYILGASSYSYSNNSNDLRIVSYKGEIMEFMLYNRALSDLELARVHFYLSSKWNIVGSNGENKMDSDNDGILDKDESGSEVITPN